MRTLRSKKTMPWVGGVTLATCLAAAGWSAWVHRNIGVAERAWQTRVQTEAALWQTDPAPSEANERALERDLAAVDAQLRSRRAELGPVAAVTAPDEETFFTLAAAIADWRTRATGAGIGLRSEEYFGFSAYTETGPTAATARAVRRQRQALEPLLGALLAARPVQLQAVRRENPVSGVSAEATAAEDFFVRSSVTPRSWPAGLAGEAFRVEFTGTTQTLRTFLNSVATLKPVALTREITVEPVAEAGPDEWVGASVSRFAVVVECVVPAAVKEAAP